MDSTGAVRNQSDLAEMVELLLDKGVVVNADIVVSIGDTELLGVEVRAAIASFETAARYGLEFPEGTDRERIEAAAERSGHPARREDRSRSLKARPNQGARPAEEPDEDGDVLETERADESGEQSDEATDADGAEEDEEDARPRDEIVEDTGGEDEGDDS